MILGIGCSAKERTTCAYKGSDTVYHFDCALVCGLPVAHNQGHYQRHSPVSVVDVLPNQGYRRLCVVRIERRQV